MDLCLADVIAYCYDNIAIVFLLIFGAYYLLFRANLNLFEILPGNQGESNENDTSATHCTDKNCVRCSLYAYVSRTAIVKLNEVTGPQDVVIADKIRDSLFPNDVDLSKSENRRRQNPNVVFYGDLLSLPYWNSDDFDDSKELENNYSDICGEFLNVYRSDNAKGWKRNTTEGGSWEVYPLINQGCIISDNASRCPQTMKTVQSLPSAMLQNVFSNVVFSVVRNSTTISEHYGPTNIRLRCHLGLLTSPACALTVSDDTRTWETGQCLVFDDSFLHSVTYNGPTEVATGNTLAENCGDEYRAILIVDLWHPALSAREKQLLDKVFAPLTAD